METEFSRFRILFNSAFYILNIKKIRGFLNAPFPAETSIFFFNLTHFRFRFSKINESSAVFNFSPIISLTNHSKALIWWHIVEEKLKKQSSHICHTLNRPSDGRLFYFILFFVVDRICDSIFIYLRYEILNRSGGNFFSRMRVFRIFSLWERVFFIYIYII